MAYVSVEQIRQAALQLIAQNKPPNCTGVAKRLKIKTRHLRYLIFEKYPLFSISEVIVTRGETWNLEVVYEKYRDSVVNIRESGNLPCVSRMAVILKIRLDSARRFLRLHTDFSDKLNLVSEDESAMWEGARKMLARGEQVTRLTLAREIGRSYTTVNSILKQHPRWIQHLGILRAENGSGVHKKLHKNNQKLAGN